MKLRDVVTIVGEALVLGGWRPRSASVVRLPCRRPEKGDGTTLGAVGRDSAG
jgi:hypothetical protein